MQRDLVFAEPWDFLWCDVTWRGAWSGDVYGVFGHGSDRRICISFTTPSFPSQLHQLARGPHACRTVRQHHAILALMHLQPLLRKILVIQSENEIEQVICPLSLIFFPPR